MNSFLGFTVALVGWFFSNWFMQLQEDTKLRIHLLPYLYPALLFIYVDKKYGGKFYRFNSTAVSLNYPASRFNSFNRFFKKYIRRLNYNGIPFKKYGSQLNFYTIFLKNFACRLNFYAISLKKYAPRLNCRHIFFMRIPYSLSREYSSKMKIAYFKFNCPIFKLKRALFFSNGSSLFNRGAYSKMEIPSGLNREAQEFNREGKKFNKHAYFFKKYGIFFKPEAFFFKIDACNKLNQPFLTEFHTFLLNHY